MIKYKLVDQDMCTRAGSLNQITWRVGERHVATGAGDELCTSDLIHYYDSPELAAMMNPIHADIQGYRTIEIEIDSEVANDGTKGGCKKATMVREIDSIKPSMEQRVKFSIYAALQVCRDPGFGKWAENWLNGTDRSAEAAARAAEAEAARAAWAAWAAARAAAEAARAVEAADAAARAAAAAARAAARAANKNINLSNLAIKAIRGTV